MKYFIIKDTCNYADEFDMEGFILIKKESKKDVKNFLIKSIYENFEKNEILIERLKTVEKLNSEYSRRVQVLEKLRHQLIYHFYFVK